MNFIDKMIDRFIKVNKRLKRWQRVVSVLSAVVVFITTYTLVLPAITLDKETASTQAGMEIAASENEPSGDGTVYEAMPEEETEETQEEEPAEESQEEEAAEETQAEMANVEQQKEAAAEDSGSESGSQEAEASEELSEDADDNSGSNEDAAAAETVQENVSEEEPAAESGEKGETAVAGETTEIAKPVEEIQLITEKTQLVYQYIDESFENDLEDDVDDGYTVYAEFDADAKLPVGVELRVREITKESDPDTYEEYYEKALSEMQDKYDENTSLSFAKFYDISFVFNGEEVEPSGNVKVRIEYNKPVEVKTDGNVDTVHFDKNNEEKPEVIQSDVDTRKQDDEDAMEAVEFESDQFSVYGVVGTSSLVSTFVGTDGKTYEVTVTCDADANIPADAELIVSEVPENAEKYNTYLEGAEQALNVPTEGFTYSKLLDISIVKEGKVLTPESPVHVEIKLLDKEDATEKTNLNVIHYEGETENPTVVEGTKEEEGSVRFETEGFSVYGVFYTVDFHFEVNGKVYDFSIPGGGFVSLEHLVEALGIARTNDAEDENNSDEGKSEGEDLNSAADLNDLEISKESRLFVQYVDSAVFSTPELVWVGKVEEDSTVDALKKTNKLECQYSSNLTQEQIDKINAQEVKSGDWALISLKPFISTETLTVTMKNGDVFTINVTDAQDVTLHFVDNQGNPLSGFTYKGQEISGDSFVITDQWAQSQGSINLEDFVTDGYTLSNTHKSTWHDLEGEYVSDPSSSTTNGNYPHTIIGNELRWNNEKLQYKLYYTNNDKAGWYWFDAGTEPVRNNPHWNYDSSSGSDPTDHTAVDDNDEHPYDYYLVYSSTTKTDDHGTPTPIEPPSLGEIGQTKELSSNYDGTYNLELGVSGKKAEQEEANSINVIIVMDTSSSMTRNYWNEETASQESDSRLYNTRNALKEFVTEISGYNTPENPDAVEMAFITFNRKATDIELSNGSGDAQYWTTNGSAVNSAIDSKTSTNTGTNWSWAIKLADDRLKAHNDGDPTYVLFVTDGAPSQYWDSVVEGYYVSGQGCYLGARDDARELIRDGATLYGIFAFGPEKDRQNDYLGELVDYSYNSSVRGTYRFNVQDPETLEERLKSILETIKNEYGFGKVQIDDGITELTTVTFEDADPESFIYTIKYKDYSSLTEFEEKTVDTPVTGEGNNQIIHIPEVHYKTLKDGELVPVDTDAVDIKGASFATDPKKKVTWRLEKSDGGTYLLEDGWTYNVKFKIWPSQPTYDLLAALNNSLLAWGDDYTYIDDEGRSHTIPYAQYNAQIYESGGKYILRTNTDANVTYYQATDDETVGDPITVPLPEVGGMPLDNTQMLLKKEWNTSLSTEDYDRIPSVDLYILADATDDSISAFNAAYDAYVEDPTDEEAKAAFEATYYTKVTLTRDQWKANVSIAPGVYDQYGKLKTLGHTYTILEPGIDPHYELVATPTHPMLNGLTHDKDDPDTLLDMVDIYGYDTSSLDVDDPSSYPTSYAVENKASVYSVANTLKGGININKVIEIEDPLKPNYNMQQLFNFKITLMNSEGEPEHTGGPEDGNGTLGYRVFAPVSPLPEGVTIEDGVDSAGNPIRYYTFNGLQYVEQTEGGTVTGYAARGVIEESGEVTLSIRECESIRIVNVPMGTKYIVEEIGIEDTEFDFKQSRWVVRKNVDGTMVDVEGMEEIITNSTETSTHDIVPDAENNVTYTNKPKKTEVEILKIDGSKQTETALSGVVFQLQVKSGSYQPVGNLAGYKNIEGLGTVTVDGSEYVSAFTTTDAEHKLSKLPNGEYLLKEVYTVPGYINAIGDIHFKVVKGVVSCTEADDNPDLEFIPATSGNTSTLALLKIKNYPGAELPYTGGPGTGLFITLGSIMILMAGVLLLRRRIIL